MEVKLDRFKVYNFRSIEESEWIELTDADGSHFRINVYY